MLAKIQCRRLLGRSNCLKFIRSKSKPLEYEGNSALKMIMESAGFHDDGPTITTSTTTIVMGMEGKQLNAVKMNNK
jgi:hypothetical protein